MKTVKQSKAAARKREAELLAELCAGFGYSFADTLPSKDRSTMLMTTTRINGKFKRRLDLGLCVKLMVPAEGALGQQITKLRAATPKKKAKR